MKRVILACFYYNSLYNNSHDNEQLLASASLLTSGVIDAFLSNNSANLRKEVF